MDQSTRSIHSKKLCISIVPIFNHLTTEAMNEIIKETTSRSYQRGETIYRAGWINQGRGSQIRIIDLDALLLV